mgnify:CR=1 FL=1
MIRRARVPLVAVTALSLGLSTGIGAAGAAAPASAAVSEQSEHVIVLLRDQHLDVLPDQAGMSRRSVVTGADQSRLTADVAHSGGRLTASLHVLNAFAATVSAAESARLAIDPAVASVVPDRLVAAPRHQAEPTGTSAPVDPTGPRSTSRVLCPADPAHPLLEPQALELTHTANSDPAVPSAQQIATGKGVRVAFLADGLDVNLPDFIRADGSHVIADYKDFSGEGLAAPTSGAEAFGDASAIAAQGRQRYDLSQFVNPAHPLPAGCTIRVLGTAPDAQLVAIKVFPAGGFGFNSAILAGLEYAVTVDHVDVVNESFGSNQFPDTNNDPTALFNALLARSGVTVVASSGDAGPQNTIGSPASTPGVISTGATTMFRGLAQSGYYGYTLSNGAYSSDNISALSSSGITHTGAAINLLAPGDLGWALCSPKSTIYLGCGDLKGKPSPIQLFGGTSQSAPLTAGAAADVIQAFRDTHHHIGPSPALVQQILTSSADDLGLPGSEQGAGLLDTLRAVQTARSVPGSIAPAADALLATPTQADLTVGAGAAAQSTVTISNIGSQRQVLRPSVRSVTDVLRDDRQTVVLSPATDQTLVSPTGLLRSYRKAAFTVPTGASRLTSSIAWPNSGQIVRFALLDPHGTYTAYDLPQGFGNFGSVDVRNPLPGTWTTILITPAVTGYAGPVSLQTTSYRSTTIGTAGPGPIVLEPGQSRPVTFSLPGRPAGDYGDTLQFTTAGGSVRLGVPVITRVLVSTGRAGGSFSGTFDGGNGRGGVPSPSRTYAFDVPPGQKQLAVDLTVPGAGQQVYGFLIDPQGEPVSERTNAVPGASGAPTTLVGSLQFSALDPRPGRWLFIFAVFGPVAGTSTTTGFNGDVRYDTAQVTAAGIPTSRSTVLAAGRPVTATVQLTNTGAADATFFLDGRLAQRGDLTLVGRNTTETLNPTPVSPFPAFSVPTQTDRLSVTSQANHPVLFEISPFPADHLNDLAFEGDPDVEAGPAGLTPSVIQRDPTIAPQTWLALPSQVGPFTTPGPTATVTFAATVHTRLFDRAVRTSTGDPLLATVDPAGPSSTPLPVTSGGTGTITVTITPNGTSGTVVSGFLYLNSTDPITGSTQEVAALPYTYRIG